MKRCPAAWQKVFGEAFDPAEYRHGFGPLFGYDRRDGIPVDSVADGRREEVGELGIAGRLVDDQEEARESRQKKGGFHEVHARKDGPGLWRIKAPGGIIRPMTHEKKPTAAEAEKPAAEPKPAPPEKPKKVEEIGGLIGPEPTRYGDWQFNGKVTDF